MAHVLKIAARGSLLSLAQARGVAAALVAGHPELKVELVPIVSSGDRIADRPLHEFGGKGLFTKELEQALLAGTVDAVIHSYKDVPVTMPLVDTAELVIAAVPVRAAPWDVLISPAGGSLADLPAGARIGTGSLRRQAQLAAARPDLQLLGIRGNIDTRLRKLEAGDYDALVLAQAGLSRAGLFDAGIMHVFDPDVMLPAAGQGALALECRQSDTATRGLLAALNDAASAACVELERQIVRRLDGDCFSPIAAFAHIDGHHVELRAAVGGRAGRGPVVRAAAEAESDHAEAAVDEVMAQLEAQGARQLLAGGA
jgi:hydroxymethylbilane synthase